MIAARILMRLAGLACSAATILSVAPAQAGQVAAQARPQTAEAAVLARGVLRGETLAADDFTTTERSAAQVRGTLSAAQAAGKEVLRNLPAGMVVRASDLVVPRLVRRGEPVTIKVRSGGLTIATGGRALGSGGMGDMVRVVSTSTNRTLDGVVEGSGAVRVTTP